MNIKEQIKTMRTSRNLTRKDLANLLNISEESIKKFESGEREPKISLLYEMASKLNFNLSLEIGVPKAKGIDLISFHENLQIEALQKELKETEFKLKEAYSDDLKLFKKILKKRYSNIEFSAYDYKKLFKEHEKFNEYLVYKLSKEKENK